MKTIAVLIPIQEYLNSFKGGAIARWVYEVYSFENNNYQFNILGRVLDDNYDYEDVNSLRIKSKFNHLFNFLTKTPIIRNIFKPFISSIYIKAYKKEILANQILEIHNSVEYINKIRKMNYKGKIILHMHNDYLNHISEKLLRALNSQVDLIIFPSNALRTEFKTLHPNFSKPVEVVYNGFDPKKFFLQENKSLNKNPIIGYIGRFDKNKNILNLLDIYSLLLEKIPKLEFYLIGSGKSGGLKNKYQKKVLKKIDKINSKNGNIKYLGYVHNYELINYYNLFDLFISLPTQSEAFGMTFVESLACKTLVLGTNLGGIPEAIGSKELLINNPLNHNEVINKILDILDNEKSKKELKEKTFSYVLDNFTWEEISKRQFKLLSNY